MSQWVAVWGQAHTDISQLAFGKKSHTVRMAFPVGMSGTELRFRFANYEGKKPLHIDAVTAGVRGRAVQTVRFAGKEEAELLPGADICSDPLPVDVKMGDDITVTMALTGCFGSGNMPNEMIQTSKKGNYAHEAQMPLATQNFNERFFDLKPVLPALAAVEVLTEETPEVIVCIGNSITQQGQWTNPLRDMFRNAGIPVSIVNEGIGGNRLIHDAMPGMPMYGKSAVHRFERDVLRRSGVTAVIIEEGTNDLNMAKDDKELALCDADHLAAAYTDLVKKAKDAGLKVYAATVTPRGGTKNWTERRESERCKLNDWMRKCGLFDGVLDYDAVTQDAVDSKIFAPACDSGDHLHPNSIGGLRMASEAFRILKETLL